MANGLALFSLFFIVATPAFCAEEDVFVLALQQCQRQEREKAERASKLTSAIQDTKKQIVLAREKNDVANYLASSFVLLQLESLRNEGKNDWNPHANPFEIARERFPSRPLLDVAREAPKLPPMLEILLQYKPSSEGAARFIVVGSQSARSLLFLIPTPGGQPRYVFYSPKIPCADNAFRGLKSSNGTVYEIPDPRLSRERYKARTATVKAGDLLTYTKGLDAPEDYLFWAALGLFHNDNFAVDVPATLMTSPLSPPVVNPQLKTLRDGTLLQKQQYFDAVVEAGRRFVDLDPQFESIVEAWAVDKDTPTPLVRKIVDHLIESESDLSDIADRMHSSRIIEIVTLWADDGPMRNRVAANPLPYMALVSQDVESLRHFGRLVPVRTKISMLAKSYVRDLTAETLASVASNSEVSGSHEDRELLDFLLDVSKESYGIKTVASEARNFLASPTRLPTYWSRWNNPSVRRRLERLLDEHGIR